MNENSDFSHLGGINPVVGQELVPMQETEIDALEQRLGTSLPASYRRFLQRYGAVSFGKLTAFSPVKALPPRVSFTGEGSLSYLYGARCAAYGNTYDLDQRIRMYSTRMPETLIPIGGDGAGDQICLGIGGQEVGRVYYWDHHNEWDEDDYLEDYGEPMPAEMKFQNVHLIAESFEDFLDRLKVIDE